jgi:hypothetical protein
VTTYTPGDILLVDDYDTKHFDLLGNLIRAGERARDGATSDGVRWTHSAMIVSADGDLAEALEGGIARTNIRKYHAVETLVVSPPIPADDPRRAYAVRFALAQVGTSYDVMDFVSLAMSLLTRLDWSLHSDKRFICSGLCARATEAYTDSGYPYPSEAILPADLGAYWGASSGAALPSVSFFGRALDLLKAVSWALSPFRSGIRPVSH